VIVLDASAAVLGLLRDGPTRAIMGSETVVDVEVASMLRRHVRAGALDEPAALAALDVWQALAISYHPGTGLLARVWELRENVTAYDASTSPSPRRSAVPC